MTESRLVNGGWRVVPVPTPGPFWGRTAVSAVGAGSAGITDRPSRGLLTILTILAMGSVGACTPDVSDGSGIAQAVAQPSPIPDLELVTVVAAGGGYEYGTGRDADVLSDGRVVYVDRQGARVHIFSADGRYSHSFGSRGGGPGEFETPVWVEVGPDDRIAVSDFVSLRVTVFDVDGNVLHTVPTEFPKATPTIHWGSAHLYVHIQGEADIGNGVESVNKVDRVVFGEGRTARTELDVAVPFGHLFEGDSATCPGCALLPGPHGGIAFISKRPRYRVVEFARDLSVLGVWGRDDRAQPIYTPEEQEQFVRTNQQMYEALNLGDWKGEAPRFRPHIQEGGVAFDHRGRMWALPVVSPGEHRVLEVFGADGVFLGQVEPPVPEGVDGAAGTSRFSRELTSIRIRGDRLIAMTTDEWDVPVILVWRIRGGA